MTPTPAQLQAIRDVVETGKWPKAGTLPVCVRLGR